MNTLVFSSNGNSSDTPEKTQEHLLPILDCRSSTGSKNTHKSARHTVHYASGHYQDLLFPRGTDKATDSRDDF